MAWNSRGFTVVKNVYINRELPATTVAMFFIAGILLCVTASATAPVPLLLRRGVACDNAYFEALVLYRYVEKKTRKTKS